MDTNADVSNRREERLHVKGNPEGRGFGARFVWTAASDHCNSTSQGKMSPSSLLNEADERTCIPNYGGGTGTKKIQLFSLRIATADKDAMPDRNASRDT